jgi:hypothetical protein
MVERFEVLFISFVESSSDPSLHFFSLRQFAVGVKWNENAMRHHDKGMKVSELGVTCRCS